jgi:hypothetical protein
MSLRLSRWIAVLLACLLAAGCQDRQRPKPTVQPSASAPAL